MATLKTTPATGPTATLSIAAGTQMLDASGNVINASSLSSSIIQYNPNSPSGVLSMPSSAAMNVVGPGGTTILGETHFIFGGVLAINMTAGGTVVKKFSKPIQASIDLPAGYTNITTGSVVAAGDVIPVWSQDDQSGQYTYEGTATVATKTGGGGLVANFAISHLTNWSLGQYYLYRDKSGNLLTPCKFGVKVTLTAKVDKIGTYQIQLLDAQSNMLSWTYFYPTTATTVITFADALPLTNTRLVVYYCDFQNYYNWVNVGSSTSPIASLCSGTATVNLNNTPATLDYVNVKLNLTAKCTNKNVIAAPSGWFYIYDNTFVRYASALYLQDGKIVTDNGGYASAGALSSGDLSGGTAQLINGHSYTFSIIYGDTYYATSAFTVTKGTFNIPQITAGGGLSGSSTYSSSTNTLSINASYTLTNCQ